MILKFFLIAFLFLLPNISIAADYYTAATARAQVRILLDSDENSNNFFTDTEIDNWVQEATEYISSMALCIQSSDTFLLVTSQYEYTDFVTGGAAEVTDIVKIWGAFYISPDNEYIGLKRINANQIADLPFMIAGPPKYYYLIANVVGILPLPTSTENGESVRIYYSTQSQTVGDLPNEYQPLTFLYAASMACASRGNSAKSKEFYDKYIAILAMLKQELYKPAPEVPTK